MGFDLGFADADGRVDASKVMDERASLTPNWRGVTNLLISSAADEFTGCPEYKVCAVRLAKSTPAAAK